MVSFLFSQLKDTSILNSDQNALSPLHLASENGHLHIATYLLDQGASVNKPDRLGHPPLYYALNQDMASLLLLRGASPIPESIFGLKILHEVVKSDLDNSHHLLFHLSGIFSINQKDKYGDSALITSIKMKKDIFTRILIYEGASLEETTQDGDTAIFVALSQNDDMANCIVNNGASLIATNKDGDTPLFVALSQKHDSALTMIDKGASLTATNKDGDTPLFYALSNDHYLASYLIDKGASLTATNKDGETPLFVALSEKPWLAHDMIERGASITATNKDGDTPLLFALSHERWSAARYMIEKGASLKATNKAGKTAHRIIWEKGMTHILPKEYQDQYQNEESFWLLLFLFIMVTIVILVMICKEVDPK